MIFYKTNLFYKIIPLTKKKKKTVTFAHIISRNRRQFPNSNLQLIKRSKRSNPNDSPKRVISSKVITIANIFTMLLQRRGEEGWKQTGRERSHLVEGEAFHGSLILRNISRSKDRSYYHSSTYRETRDERKFRLDDAKFDDGGVGGSSRD